MPEYLHPGVYIDEVASPTPRIRQAATSTAGFIGPTERAADGEDDLTVEPRLVAGMVEFERLFGGNGPAGADGSRLFALAESVRMYFDNGGRRCVIVSTGGFTIDDGIRTPRVG